MSYIFFKFFDLKKRQKLGCFTIFEKKILIMNYYYFIFFVSVLNITVMHFIHKFKMPFYHEIKQRIRNFQLFYFIVLIIDLGFIFNKLFL
ncbi:hypothetical protein Phi48:2_gp03 [Cellulophaga phage phi48:2]|uniref:hypothetical protein n=1 Tax=Cellulophaga phage phi48:2 TaxID=1327968 RepID=UPI000351BA15|nr:hypothetical protein Phi48:2_gp03 [Cellulophaga phage phi48:2]AGO47251.1 hypothetical protein Phi48:2_gp03 [Cellulophaga phage phi48:2]